MHRIRNPCHNMPCPTNGPDQMRKFHPHVLGPHSRDDRYPSWFVLSGSLTDPEKMGRAVIVKARGGVETCEGLLVRQEQALVRRPEFSGFHYGMVHCEPGRLHET
ncbi:glutathione s-transferase family protein, partial [Striga asiatica]